MTRITIQPDADLFETIAHAAFTNPFGQTRDRLDRAISGLGASATDDEILRAALRRTGVEIEQLVHGGRARVDAHEGRRRDVLRRVFLFHLFHRYADRFDELIRQQLRQGDAPCRVTFARQALQDLQAFGFDEPDSVRNFAIFYQLRRAYHFIRHGLVGDAPSMRRLRKQLWNCVFTHDMAWFESSLWERMQDFSILLLGETGVGKGSAAAAIGRSGFIPFEPRTGRFSESFTRNFISINLSQYSEGVLESELFGHRKGAFTGAVDNHEGLFSRCAPHGVILLDEIGDVSVSVQIKLLQVLQDRTFYSVGSHEPRRFSGRIVAATNRDLDKLRRDGRFRDDLYYRLCSNEIVLPPLRRRISEDSRELDALIETILARLCGCAPAPSERVDQVRRTLARAPGASYSWPGNVRELEQAVKRIVLTGSFERDSQFSMPLRSSAGFSVAIDTARPDAETLLAEYCAALFDRHGTYEEVARITRLDRRTVKKYIQKGRHVSA